MKKITFKIINIIFFISLIIAFIFSFCILKNETSSEGEQIKNVKKVYNNSNNNNNFDLFVFVPNNTGQTEYNSLGYRVETDSVYLYSFNNSTDQEKSAWPGDSGSVITGSDYKNQINGITKLFSINLYNFPNFIISGRSFIYNVDNEMVQTINWQTRDLSYSLLMGAYSEYNDTTYSLDDYNVLLSNYISISELYLTKIHTNGFNSYLSPIYESGMQPGFSVACLQFSTIYSNGYDNGYNIGYNSGQNAIDTTKSYEQGYNQGYTEGEQKGYENGKNVGYDNGYNIGYGEGLNQNSNIFDFIRSILATAVDILNVEIFPNFRLWYIFGIPLVLSLIAFIVKISK